MMIDKDINAKSLAADLDINIFSLYRYLSGSREFPLKIFIGICLILNCSPHDLLDGVLPKG